MCVHFENMLASHFSKKGAKLDPKQGACFGIFKEVQAFDFERMWSIINIIIHLFIYSFINYNLYFNYLVPTLKIK